MTIREAAEVLYDEYTGTKGRLGNSTQEARWIAFTERVVGVAGQGVIDQESANEAARNQLRAQCRDLTEMQVRHKGKMIAGAVLSVLETRTVAQVKAEALREAAQGFQYCDEYPYRASRPSATEEYLNALAEGLEREDGR